MKSLLNKIRKISKLRKKNLERRTVKLGEEYGELCAEVMKYLGEKGSDKSKSQIMKDLHEEAIDCMIMAMDILVHTKASDKEIEKILNLKLDKWKKNWSN